MAWLRTCLLVRPWLALAVMLASLAVRIAVPSGMMPGHGGTGPALVFCSGRATTAMFDDAMSGMAMPHVASGKVHDGHPKKAIADAPCAYTGLLAAVLAVAALPGLVAMLLSAIASPVPAMASATVRRSRLWPPRRGPPVASA